MRWMTVAAALAVFPFTALAQPAPDAWRGTCAAVADAVARDRAREAAAFQPSLTDIPKAVLAGRADPAPGAVDRDEALAIGRAVWDAWGWRAQGTRVAIAAEEAGAWMVRPEAARGPEALAPPMRVDKRTGQVTWRLPHPTAKEAWLARHCAPAPGAR